MKRNILIQTLVLIFFLILTSVIKGWLKFSYWPLWLGGIIGSAIPDLDHIIYVFFLGPQDLTSQRIVYLIRNKSFMGALKLLVETRAERTELVLHSNLFVTITVILVFWMFTSSGSTLGIGLVLGMAVHLLLDRLAKALYHVPHDNGI